MDDNKSQYSGAVVVFITILAAAFIIYLYAFGILARFELFVLDHNALGARIPSISFLKNFKPPQDIPASEGLPKIDPLSYKPKHQVILIDMPESSAAASKGPNVRYCALTIKILSLWKAKAIVLADLLPEQVGSGEESEFIEAAMLSKGLYLPALYDMGSEYVKLGYQNEPSRWAKEPWPVLLGPGVSIGQINAFPDVDDRLRQVPVVAQYGGRRIYQLGLKVAMDVIGVEENYVELDPAGHTLLLKTFSGKRIMVPLEKNNQLTIKWVLRNGVRINRVSFRDILESYRIMQYGARPIIDPQIFDGSICILGAEASNDISGRPPLIKDGHATSAVCALVASSLINEDFVHRIPKIVDIYIILAVILFFGMAFANLNFLRIMMMVVVAIILFSLAPVFHMTQNTAIIVIVLMSVPLGIFMASSHIFSGMVFTALSMIGYYLVASGIFNASGLILPIIFPIIAMAVILILFYIYNRFKDYLGKEHLFSLASRDGLTGLKNRRSLNVILDEVLNNSIRHKSRKLSILMCDIDNFKKLNDTHGHQAGDMILKSFAKIMRSKCRQSDIVARYGGEEFLIIFPGVPAKNALRAAESIRKAISEENFVFKGQSYSTSMSMGLAEYTKEKTKEELIEKADQALYRAKKEGKNRVCM